MRYKFRAWDNDNNTMYYNINKLEFSLNSDILTANAILNGAISHKMVNFVNDEFNSQIDANQFDLMQSVGFNDINGITIYEGDICIIQIPGPGFLQNIKSKFLAYVEYKEDLASFVFHVYIPSNHIFHFNKNITSDCKIVGNIFENKDSMDI